MKTATRGGVYAASILACGMAAFAQAPQQQPPSSPAPAAPTNLSGTQASADQTLTISGCIQREADYRKARDAGRGGVVGTGLGAANEFVLINASASTTEPGRPTGTSGTSMMAYELTGSGEGQAAGHVGKRVEVMGKVKAADTTAAGRPTGGATAGKPPDGIDVTSSDLKLRELEVTSIKEVAGTCPAQ